MVCSERMKNVDVSDRRSSAISRRMSASKVLGNGDLGYLSVWSEAVSVLTATRGN
jgi:hypothetical protein